MWSQFSWSYLVLWWFIFNHLISDLVLWGGRDIVLMSLARAKLFAWVRKCRFSRGLKSEQHNACDCDITYGRMVWKVQCLVGDNLTCLHCCIDNARTVVWCLEDCKILPEISFFNCCICGCLDWACIQQVRYYSKMLFHLRSSSISVWTWFRKHALVQLYG